MRSTSVILLYLSESVCTRQLDMKVPDLQELADVITEYKQKTGKKLVFLADTTFAPGSQVSMSV